MSAPIGRDRGARFGAIARSLDPTELQRDGRDAAITAAEVMADLSEAPHAARLLGYYSPLGVERAFERYGVLGKLRERGFADLELAVDPSDPDRQLVRIHGSRGDGPRALLVELVVRRRAATIAGAGSVELLSVEWLLLQDPTARFSRERPRMPGQEHPGLGLAHDVQGLLVQACARLGLDGITSRPSHYHSAVEAAPDFRFQDPAAEGRFRAMRRVLAGRELDVAAWIVEDGRLRTADGAVVAWLASDHVLPVSARLRSRLLSAASERRAASACRELLDAGLHVERQRA